MNSIKCRNCGLSNFAIENECRRCGSALYGSGGRSAAKEKRPRRFSVISLVIYAALAIGGYYLYQSFLKSVNEVNANDAYRVGTQPPQKPQQAGLSRTEYDRQRSSQVGNALKENPSFAAQKQHDADTQRAMQQASNSQQ